MKIGVLTRADLRYWFERPHATVRMWVLDGWTPRGPAGELAGERLALLERAVKQKRGMPVPRTLSARERPAYIKQVRDGLERVGVPESGSA